MMDLFELQAKLTNRSKHGTNLVNGLSNGSKQFVSPFCARF